MDRRGMDEPPGNGWPVGDGSMTRRDAPVSAERTPGRALVAGVGNLLRGDDGFGPAVIRALEDGPGLRSDVTLMEVGIGGMSLVHELMSGYETLVIVDAVDGDGDPGTLYLEEPGPADPPRRGGEPEATITADLHEIVPERVLELARALDILPPRTWIVGCQPARTDELALELSPEVERAVGEAARTVRRLVEDAGGDGTHDPAEER